jgi:hypothetical protein
VISAVSFAVGGAVQNSGRSVDEQLWTSLVHFEDYVGGINYRWPSTAWKPVNASLQGVIPTVHRCEDD